MSNIYIITALCVLYVIIIFYVFEKINRVLNEPVIDEVEIVYVMARVLFIFNCYNTYIGSYHYSKYLSIGELSKMIFFK